MLADEARHHLDGDANGKLNDMMSNLGDYDTLRQMERVTRLRESLKRNHLN